MPRRFSGVTTALGLLAFTAVLMWTLTFLPRSTDPVSGEVPYWLVVAITLAPIVLVTLLIALLVYSVVRTLVASKGRSR